MVQYSITVLAIILLSDMEMQEELKICIIDLYFFLIYHHSLF